MNSLMGQQWSHYHLTRLLGQGGFAEVYPEERVRLEGMRAAIKVLHPLQAGEAVTDFQQEASMIARLQHPNSVRVLDFDVREGNPLLVLDSAAQGSLRHQHPRDSKLLLGQVVEYIRQAACQL